VTVLSSGGVEKEAIDEVLLVGGSAGLSGLTEKLELFFGESSRVSIRSDLDSSQLIAKGAVSQARILVSLPKDDPLHIAFAHANEVVKVTATTKPIGVDFPGSAGNIIPVIIVPSETPLPARRVVRLPVATGASKVAVEVWEGDQSLRDLPKEEKVKTAESDDEDEEEEDEEEPLREVIVTKSKLLGGLLVDIAAPTPAPAPTKKNSKVTAKPSFLEIKIDANIDGSVEVSSRQATEKDDGAWVSFSVGK